MILRKSARTLYNAAPKALRPTLLRLRDKLRKATSGEQPPPQPMTDWQKLLKQASGNIFVPPEQADFDACAKIQEAYRPVLKRFGVPYRQFFQGSIKDSDAAALHALVRTRKPKLAFQVGTFAGYSAMIIAHALADNGEGLVIACDPEIPHRTLFNPVDIAREISGLLDLSERIDFVRGWFALPMGDGFDEDIVREIPVIGRHALSAATAGRYPNGVDLAFIDADHSITATICDLTLMQEFLAVDGVVIIHDVRSWPSVAHGLLSFWEDIYFYFSATPSFFELDILDGPDGLGALRRKRRSQRPMLRIRVLDADTDSPIPQAVIHLLGTKFESRCGADGSVYWWGDCTADTLVSATAPGYPKHQEAVGVATNGRSKQKTIYLRRTPAPVL